MGLDPLSAIAPARLRVILVPAGPIRQSKFDDFVDRLRQEHVVRLGDVSPDGRPHRTMFSPLAFPTGSVIYDLSTSLPSPSHLTLAPFELYREPLMVLGIADHASMVDQLVHEIKPLDQNHTSTLGPAHSPALAKVLSPVLAELQVEFPRALIHELLVFDLDDSTVKLPDGIIAVPSPELSKTTTIKTVMCDLTSHLLAEMTTYAKSLQALPMVESPKQGLGPVPFNGHVSGLAAQMGFLAESYRQPTVEGLHGRPPSRTSIPLHIAMEPRSGLSTSENRSTTSSDGTRTPPTTFDEIAMGSSNPPVAPPPITDAKRPLSQDKVAVHGFGAGSFGERERNKGKGRVGIIIGSLYLLAGRWPDAVRELTENAMIARTHNDHIWHAKALDYLIVCLLMYAWAGLDFRIPPILFPATEKQSSKPQGHAPLGSPSELASQGSSNALSLWLSLQKLTSVLPEVVQHILNLYIRARTFTEDKLPQLSFSDSTIRFAKLLSVINLSHGILDEVGLRRIVLNQIVLNQTVLLPSTSPKENRPFLTKAELATLLSRALPGTSSTDSVSAGDHIMILSGMASVLSDLSFRRKKAFILREMLSVLLPALVQARKYGAAEMGLHPAASILSNGAVFEVGSLQTSRRSHETGIRGLLSLVCHAYDILLSELGGLHSKLEDPFLADLEKGQSHLDKSELVIARVLRQASMRLCGDYRLKLEVLGLCTSICEALPDLQGVLSYTTEILRAGGSDFAPGPDYNGGSPFLAHEEQTRLANNISRAISAGRQLGVPNIEADYWNEFLVRRIELVKASPLASPRSHARADLGVAKTLVMEEEKGPFIYNPFRKSASSVSSESFVVAEEETAFQVTLQNLYDFEVEIETIKLDSSGSPFECEPISTVVGPYRTQNIILCGTARKPGALTITGCTAKVSGCRERGFPMFSEPWKPKIGVKIGRPEAVDFYQAKRPGTETNIGSKDATHQDLITSSITLKVIKAQPNFVVKSVSLPQSAVMLLEGETKTFNVVLQNVSSVPVNLLLLSFEDSMTSQLRSASTNKDLSPSEVYELEYASIGRQSFRWKRKSGSVDTNIDPGMETSIEIEVLGKPALSYGKIQVDYGYLEESENETTDPFYTRQLTIPITITVNASVELVRSNLLPFHTDFAWHNMQGTSTDRGNLPQSRSQEASLPSPLQQSDDRFQSLLSRIGLNPQNSNQCLLYLDLRNSWPNVLSISIEIRSPVGTSGSWKHGYTIHEHLQPGHTSRILLLLPRIYLPNSTAPIPSLTSAGKRQYVVSSGPKPNPETERASREAFHYREALLDHIRATWEEESTKRTGIINLRALNLTTRMVSVLKLDDLEITLSIRRVPSSGPTAAPPPFSSSSSSFSSSSSPSTTSSTSSPSPFTTPHNIQNKISPQTFFTLLTTLTNRSPSPIHPFLRIQPSIPNQPPPLSLDLGKKFLWTGLLQRGLAVLKAGETTKCEVGCVVLCTGRFEVSASVEEVRVMDSGDRVGGEKDDGGGGGGGKEGGWEKREGRERRVWHARENLVIVVED